MTRRIAFRTGPSLVYLRPGARVQNIVDQEKRVRMISDRDHVQNAGGREREVNLFENRPAFGTGCVLHITLTDLKRNVKP